MRKRTSTQTVGKKHGGYFVVNAVIPPVGGSIELDGSTITVRTFKFQTNFTPETCEVLRFYKYRLILKYRAIVKHNGEYRAVDFRGVEGLRNPEDYEKLGFQVTRIMKFFRRSFDVEDGEKYDLDFSPG